MKVYLAGPMTGYADLNFPKFAEETARLRALGLVVVSPAEVNPDHSMPWLECMRRDIPHLVTCDAVAVLPGWSSSRGANVEVTLAQGLGFKVAPVGHWK